MADMTITEFARLGGLARAKKLGPKRVVESARKASEAARRARLRRKRAEKSARAA